MKNSLSNLALGATLLFAASGACGQNAAPETSVGQTEITVTQPAPAQQALPAGTLVETTNPALPAPAGTLVQTIEPASPTVTLAPATASAPVVIKAPVPTAPHDTLTIPANKPPLSSAAMPAATISVSAVGAPTIDGVGVLSEGKGGLPALIWKDSTADTASPLLQWMRGGIASQALRDMTVNLLLTQATPPTGAKDWFDLRLRALIAMGEDEKAEQLIGSVPLSMETDALAQTRAELLLMRGDIANACPLADSAIAAPATASVPFWQKMSIVCKALNGKTDEAMLALDLMRESGEKDEPFLQNIIRRMGDKNFQIKSLPATWTVFDVAILRLAGETNRVKDQLDAVPPVALKYIAADTTLDPKLRDKAEGKAIQLAILPVKDVNKTPFLPFANPLASDVTTLVTALESGAAPTEADNAVIARLVLDSTAATQDMRRVQRLLTLMEPFGYRVESDTWTKLFQRKSRYDGDMPPAIFADRLNAAAKAGRNGEVIILSALMLGPVPPEKLHETVLLPVIKALIAAGYTKEARLIAYDAVQSYRPH